jgi:hypothetical protein
MGWFSKKVKHRPGIKTKYGVFLFSEDFGSWSWWPSGDDGVALIYRDVDFDVAALDALNQLLPELDSYASKALAFIKQSEWAENEVVKHPESIEFTKILDRRQIEIDFAEEVEHGLHFTIKFVDGEPTQIFAGD